MTDTVYLFNAHFEQMINTCHSCGRRLKGVDLHGSITTVVEVGTSYAKRLVLYIARPLRKIIWKFGK